MSPCVSQPPPWATACIMLADGSVFWGHGIGATGRAIGELCFNTAMTGYQEIVTDPSYAGQIITFTFPHIGNTGANGEDIEAQTPAARGIVIRDAITDPSSFRASGHFDGWLRANNLVGITGIDTRRLTRLVRSRGFQTAGIDHGTIDCPGLAGELAAWPGLEGMDLAREVTCRQTYTWTESTWSLQRGHTAGPSPCRHVVAVDYGVKRNILRHLVSLGCRVTVVPATSAIADIMRHRPDGIFLSNGPGDPAATGTWAVPVIRDLLETGKPVFGICLGHQLLALALGARTLKMANGHRGANHPVRNLETGRVEITCQNHGFVVDPNSLPGNAVITHVSLFDGTLAGFRIREKPVFSVQYHPEASPGPQDSRYLFRSFIKAMENHA